MSQVSWWVCGFVGLFSPQFPLIVFHIVSLKPLYFISMNLPRAEKAPFRCTEEALMPAC